MATNVNFKILEVHVGLGCMLVEYLADGATKEKFGVNAGPFQIPIPENMNTMSEQEIKAYIASRGEGIVNFQTAILAAEQADKFSVLTNMIDQTITEQVISVQPPSIVEV